jgi:8-oxo-dGTP pyrophosphatase MutT (NUDIX family)
MKSPKISLVDPRLSTLRDKLLSLEEEFAHIPQEAPERTHAAVSIVLREGCLLEVLLIKRAEAEGDPWSGQMAFPGGRRDPTDSDLLQTAIRETLEEVSLSLGDQGIHLGRLEPTVPATTRLPPITIFPYVFGVPEGTDAQVSSREVDEILWVPLAVLQDPGSTSTVEIHYGDNRTRTFPCLRVGDRVIWGLTYRILTGFFEILRTSEPSV